MLFFVFVFVLGFFLLVCFFGHFRVRCLLHKCLKDNMGYLPARVSVDSQPTHTIENSRIQSKQSLVFTFTLLEKLARTSHLLELQVSTD